eukprot:CAMPEP_0203966870 /NCGR_PEP_ID=MMETSP0359-20131031/95986_1 /ASSEMBLY_ACC=CAM_ASM_000338 /TAXON_ID=268821 /ORGANISM="Scrippsiella Hangoei, Strain SHTV-5" /LENGTH=75 /DNA_ID=CAMNT_0050904441 /DNA_START=12 /DNA_END=236 /DNA_ORIENTATION=-
MKAKADQAVRAVEALKQQEAGGAPAPKQGGKSVTSMPVSPAPVAATAAAPVPASGISKAAIAEAEKQAKLITWAA